MSLSNQIHERFACAILELEPDFPMSKHEIQAVIKTHGLEHFCQKLSDQAKEFVEVVEIIMRLENGDLYE